MIKSFSEVFYFHSMKDAIKYKYPLWTKEQVNEVYSEFIKENIIDSEYIESMSEYIESMLEEIDGIFEIEWIENESQDNGKFRISRLKDSFQEKIIEQE